jgi:pimeloyl-ACP methyl ester carboxylesterase
MNNISTSLGQVAYDSEGDGAAVLFLASGGHDLHDFDELRQRLPDQFRSIAIDWPGHGDSPAWPQPPGELELTQMVEEIIESLCPTGAVLVGNSIGGNVAARLAATRPDLVRGLTIIDSSGFEPPLPLPGRVFCTLMSHPRFVRAIYPLFSKAYMREKTDADRRARASAIALTRTAEGSRALAAMWQSFKLPSHDLRSQASSITAPTVLVWGRHDPIVTPKCGQAANKLITGSKLVLIDSGHAPQTTNPTAVAAELVPLLSAAFPADDPTALASVSRRQEASASGLQTRRQ